MFICYCFQFSIFSCSIFIIDTYRLGWPLLILALSRGRQWDHAGTRLAGLCEPLDLGERKPARQLRSLSVSHPKASCVPSPALSHMRQDYSWGTAIILLLNYSQRSPSACCSQKYILYLPAILKFYCATPRVREVGHLTGWKYSSVWGQLHYVGILVSGSETSMVCSE